MSQTDTAGATAAGSTPSNGTPAPGRLTVTVTDTGSGPTNPFLGLLPPDHPHGSGLGLWISHQLVDMTFRRHRDGYTVRLAASGSPPSAEEHGR